MRPRRPDAVQFVSLFVSLSQVSAYLHQIIGFHYDEGLIWAIRTEINAAALPAVVVDDTVGCVRHIFISFLAIGNRGGIILLGGRRREVYAQRQYDGGADYSHSFHLKLFTFLLFVLSLECPPVVRCGRK